MHEPDFNAPPLNPLPWIVVLLALMIAGVELVFQAADAGLLFGQQGIGFRLQMLQRFVFSDEIFDWMRDRQIYPAEHLVRFVSYLFIHQSLTHAAMVLVFVLALGKFVGEIFSAPALLFTFLFSGVVGAFGYSYLLNETQPLVGGYPGVFGLIGAFTWIMLMGYRATGDNQWRAFSLIGMFMGIQLLFKLIFGGGNDWLAELIAFFTGFSLSIVLAPGGIFRLRAMVQQLRQR